MSSSSASIDAQNFFKVLSIIDRTILPRRLFLSNGTTNLVLMVARQCASLEDKRWGTNSLQNVSAAIVRLCTAGRPVAHRLEPISPAPPVIAGFAAIAIANAQDRPETQNKGSNPRQYQFAKSGWLLAAPAEASFASLEAAARVAWAMSGWQGLHGEKLQPPTLILAISDGLTDDLSVSVDGELTITSTPPSHLGHLVSRWRNRASQGENESVD